MKFLNLFKYRFLILTASISVSHFLVADDQALLCDNQTVELRQQYQLFNQKFLDVYGVDAAARFPTVAVGELEGFEFPILQDVVEEIAQKLEISSPRILLSTNPIGNACAVSKINHLDQDLILIGCDCINDAQYAFTYEELYAVIAHELSHLKHNHTNIRIQSAFKIAGVGLAAYLIYKYKFGNATLPELLNIDNKKYGVPFITKHGLIRAGAWYMGKNALDLPYHYLCRKQEKEADLTAKSLINDPKNLVNAIAKVYKLSAQVEGKLYKLVARLPEMLSSHPKLETRKKYLLG